MRVERAFAHHVILVLALVFSSDALAQAKFRIGFAGQVDCDKPSAVKNVPVRMEGNGVLNPDGSASADVTLTAFVLSSTIHFLGRLGAPPASAPGGTSQVRVAGRDRLRLIWNLPNNQFVVNIQVKGQSCSAQLQPILKPGKTQYTFFDGRTYHYCGRPRIAQSSAVTAAGRRNARTRFRAHRSV